ncbi:hypothetical protein CJ030_MR4G020931 [Morella rubra]|uniref:Uncharacterized protein n=1 Tax=Morella rubra TaxID=262757 RepID=A0A6A1VWS2_9ROSI|nr:hypothetical protein CJ030_MR4G020932 [Morella rubra]KAB1217390.1 hypothetical protein CJ030_MR4G020931 [Morella rubra]
MENLARKTQPGQPLNKFEALSSLLDDEGRSCGDDDDDDNVDDEGEGEVEHFAPSPQTCNLSHAELKKSLNGKLQELKAIVRGKTRSIILIRRPPWTTPFRLIVPWHANDYCIILLVKWFSAQGC